MPFDKACLCQYLGTHYSGWQRQKNGKSIQELIENALTKIYNHNVKIAGSGRTDSGVHAMGQVFSFSSELYRTEEAIINGCRAHLPTDIGVIKAIDVIPSFHAGKDIISKTYLYKIINTPVPAALYAERALWIRRYIDIEKLNHILKAFEGEHDFASFCVKKTKKENTVRTMNYARAERSGDEINIILNSGGFLHNMVRIIVGTTVKLLQNDLGADDAREMIHALDRRAAGPTASACGLYQKEAIYNDKGIPGLDGIPAEFLP